MTESQETCTTETRNQTIAKTIVDLLVEKEISYSDAVQVLKIAEWMLGERKVI